MIRAFSDGKDVRRNLIPSFASVNANSSHGVDGETFIRIHSNTKETRIGVDETLNISLLQIEQDRGIIEVSQVRHILTAVIFGRVYLAISSISKVHRFIFRL